MPDWNADCSKGKNDALDCISFDLISFDIHSVNERVKHLFCRPYVGISAACPEKYEINWSNFRIPFI